MNKKAAQISCRPILDTLLTFGFVALGLWQLAGFSGPTAAVLGCAAVATDPAAVQSVIRESKAEAEGPVSRTLLGVVAIDDLWGILLFSVVVAFVPGAGDGGLWVGLLESGGSLLVGGGLGLIMAMLTGRLDKGKPTLEEALAFVLLAVGLSEWLGLSYLLTAVSMGAVVSNVATEHQHTFREIENVEWPFLALFFVLSGASLEPDGLVGSLYVVAAYVGLRVLARVITGALGTKLSNMPSDTRVLGLALLPQAGVALGLVLVVAERVPDVGVQALPVVLLGTVVFEVCGPLVTRGVLRRLGEVPTA